MRTLALRHVVEDLPRLIASLAGIAFAVALVLVQGAIYAGFVRSTTLLIDQSDADFWVGSRAMSYLEITLPIPYRWVTRIRGIDGVAHAEPLAVRSGIWEAPDGTIDYVRIIGFEPDGTALRLGLAPATLSGLKRGEFAADVAQLPSLHAAGIGSAGKVRGIPARIAALTHGTQPIVSPTFVYTTLPNAVMWTPSGIGEQLYGLPAADSPLSFVLVRVRDPAARSAVAAQIESRLPSARAFPRAEMAAITRRFWIERTKIGFLIALGSSLGAFVGIVVVAQILYASVNEHLRDFGTLKALGLADASLYATIAWQALVMAILGYFPGLAISVAVILLAESTRGVSLELTPLGALIGFVVAVVMCLIAATFAVRRVLRVDPALVFNG